MKLTGIKKDKHGEYKVKEELSTFQGWKDYCHWDKTKDSTISIEITNKAFLNELCLEVLLEKVEEKINQFGELYSAKRPADISFSYTLHEGDE
tara:strand:+ start:70 stop:348 length:279 start_codon:yes stop_codon:yes gene_type:complete